MFLNSDHIHEPSFFDVAGVVQEPAREMAQAEERGAGEAPEATRGAVVWARAFAAAVAVPRALPADPRAARAAYT